MIKAQVQLPDELYQKAKTIAEQREWSFAEVVRRGLEYMTLAYPLREAAGGWKLPVLAESAFASNFDELDFKALIESDELSRHS